MTEITKEYLDKVLANSFKDSKQYLQNSLKEQAAVNLRLHTELSDRVDALAASTAQEFSAMKVSFEASFMGLDSKIEEAENQITGYHQGTTSKLSIIESKLETIQRDVKHLAKQSLDDTNVIYKDIAKLQKRIIMLENQVKKIKTKQETRN